MGGGPLQFQQQRRFVLHASTQHGSEWDRSFDVQAAEQTAHPSAVRAGGRVLPQIAFFITPRKQGAHDDCWPVATSVFTQEWYCAM